MDTDRDALYVRSVEKAFTVLEAFSAERPFMTLQDVVKATGFNKSTAQRFCHTLRQIGYLQKNVNGAYELAVKSTSLGAAFINSNSLVRRARPYLHTLSLESEGAATLALHEGDEVFFVSRFLGKYVLDTTVTVGSRLPLYCTASGRAVLSLQDDETVLEYLQRENLLPRTPKTLIDIEDIMASIRQCREQGYVVTSDQYVMADLSLSVPVQDHVTGLSGAVTLALSAARFTPKQLDQKFARLVQTAARAISS